MADEKKVVWVLGSGFSRSLGGPLLDELLHKSRFDVVEMLFDKNDHAWKAFIRGCRPIVEHFALHADDIKKNTVPWRNAEEFIEYLELAAKGEQRARDVMSPLLDAHPDAEKLARHGRELVAAITYEFVARTSLSSERWHPYQRWIRRLKRNDAVITFNYDLVVERAFSATHEGQTIPRSRLAKGMVQHDGMLHKLHGSVDWVINKNGDPNVVEEIADPLTVMKDDGYDVAIGVPGPGKMRGTNRLFSHAWICAQQALKLADSIVFVGYRFPETDSFAKQTLLNAIKENKQPGLRVHIVLGPDRDATVNRLEGMLKWTFSGLRFDMNCNDGAHDEARLWFRLIHEPMWAEDFLTVFERDAL